MKRRRFEENKIKPTKKRSDLGNIDISSSSKRNTKKVNYSEVHNRRSKKVSENDDNGKNEPTEDSQGRNKDKEIHMENADNNIVIQNPEKKSPVKKKKNTKKK